MNVAQGLSATAVTAATSAFAPKLQATNRAEFAELVRTLYHEHLLRDRAIDPAHATTQARFVAFARGGARPHCTTLGMHAGNLCAPKPQVRLLPFDGIPDWAIAREQSDESAARFADSLDCGPRGSRLDRPA